MTLTHRSAGSKFSKRKRSCRGCQAAPGPIPPVNVSRNRTNKAAHSGARHQNGCRPASVSLLLSVAYLVVLLVPCLPQRRRKATVDRLLIRGAYGQFRNWCISGNSGREQNCVSKLALMQENNICTNKLVTPGVPVVDLLGMFAGRFCPLTTWRRRRVLAQHTKPPYT